MKKTLILGAVLGLLLPFSSFAAMDSNLKYGARGQAVTEVQEFLIDQGYLTGNATGNFYALTLKAVKAFQTKENLPATGYWGAMSRSKAQSIVALSDSDSAEVSETGKSTVAVDDSANAKLLEQLKAQNTLLQTQNQNLQQIAAGTQQVVLNTTPNTVAQPDPTPSQVISSDLEFPSVEVHTNEFGTSPTLAQVAFKQVQGGDNLVLQVTTLSDYSKTLSGNDIPGSGSRGSGGKGNFVYHIPNISPSTTYSYTATITRGNEYKTYTGSFTTLIQ